MNAAARPLNSLASLALGATLLAACGGSSAPPSPSTASTAPASAAAKPSQVASAPASAAPASAAAAKPSGSAAAKPSAAASGAARVALKAAYTTTTPSQAPVWAAKEGGFFDAEGLDVTVARIVSGAPVMGALQNGEVPFAITGAQQIVQADVQGGQFVIVAGFIEKLLGSIWGISSIQSPAQLSGKAIGVTSFGSSSQLSAIEAFKRTGVQNAQWVATGGPPETLAAFTGGKIQAAPFQPPDDLRAQALGLHEVINVASLDIKTEDSVITTTRAYVKDHPDVAERFLRALVKATGRLSTDQAFLMSVVGKYADIQDPVALQHAAEYFHDKYNVSGSLNTDGLQYVIGTVADQIPEAKNAKPEQFIDQTFIQKVKASS